MCQNNVLSHFILFFRGDGTGGAGGATAPPNLGAGGATAPPNLVAQ